MMRVNQLNRGMSFHETVTVIEGNIIYQSAGGYRTGCTNRLIGDPCIDISLRVFYRHLQLQLLPHQETALTTGSRTGVSGSCQLSRDAAHSSCSQMSDGAMELHNGACRR